MGKAKKDVHMERVLSPMLRKPRARSPQQALPSALHVGVPATVSIALFATAFAVIYEIMPKTDPLRRVLLLGLQIALITVPMLAMPVLGSSITKAVARISGAMAGGWLFYGLYAAYPVWWFLSLALAAFAFLLVALSCFVPRVKDVGPVAMMSGFIVVINFSSAEAALPATIAKTVGISAAIVTYTLASIILCPYTATRKVEECVSSALQELAQVMDLLLLHPSQGDPATSSAGSSSHAVKVAAAGARDIEMAAGDGGKDPAAAAASGPSGGRGQSAQGSSSSSSSKSERYKAAAEGLATAQQAMNDATKLLPATQKEKFVGHCCGGWTRCFVPSFISRREHFPEVAALRLLETARQTLRVLLLLYSRCCATPLSARPLPPQLSSHQAQIRGLLEGCCGAAVDAMQSICTTVSGGARHYKKAVEGQHVEQLQQLLVALVSAVLLAQQQSWSGEAGGPSEQEKQQGPAAAAVGRWKAAGLQVLSTSTKSGGGAAEKVAGRTGVAPETGGRTGAITSAFQAVLSEAAEASEEARMAAWLDDMLLLRQLLRCLRSLQENMDILLRLLPGCGLAA